jgi:two-component system sensor histidine kinase CreC
MKIRTRLITVFVAITFAAVLGIVYLIAEEIRPSYLEAQEEALVDFSEMFAAVVSENAIITSKNGAVSINARLLERAFEALPKRNLLAKIYDLEKTQVDTRVYVTDNVGKVLFDSDNGRDVGKDYSRWRDVSRTLKGEYGARTSWSDPIYPEGDTMYIARPVLYNGDIIGVLSVGKPTRNADTSIANLTDKLWITGIAIALIITLVGFMINLWITRPLDELQSYALSVSRGERTPLPKIGKNEVGDVGRALESMRTALDGKTYIEEYVQTLTHELKAPVAGIRGAAELLSEPLPGDKRDKFLSNIVGQTERIQSLIERLLDLAELENAQELRESKPVKLDEVTHNAAATLAEYATARRISLDVRPSAYTVTGDAFLIEQAVSNLIKNAIEHANPRSTVIIESATDEDGITLTVTNQGQPIPDYALHQLFDRFYSLPNSEGKKGTGVGLSFVKEIMNLHNGSVSIAPLTTGITVASLIFQR